MPDFQWIGCHIVWFQSSILKQNFNDSITISRWTSQVCLSFCTYANWKYLASQFGNYSFAFFRSKKIKCQFGFLELAIMTVRISWMLTNRCYFACFPNSAVCLLATTCFFSLLLFSAIACGVWFMCTLFETNNHSSSSNRIDRLHLVLFNLCLYSSVTECISICFPGAQFHAAAAAVVFPSSSSCFSL